MNLSVMMMMVIHVINVHLVHMTAQLMVGIMMVIQPVMLVIQMMIMITH